MCILNELIYLVNLNLHVMKNVKKSCQFYFLYLV
jgi:hypothetical protein